MNKPREPDPQLVHHMRLKRPCANCPFLTDTSKAIPLREGRVESILEDLMSGKSGTFQCHKTLSGRYENDYEETGRYIPGGTEALCAGAAAVLMKRQRPCQMMMLAFIQRVSKPEDWDPIKDLVID